ncbi:Uncharacterized protein APZ42_000227, partial [Daphnia magna]
MIRSSDGRNVLYGVLPSTSSTHQSNSARTEDNQQAESERLKKARKQSSWIWKHTT